MKRKIMLASLLMGLSLGAPGPVLGTQIVCTIDNGNLNGFDSGNGFPGSDNPDGVDDWYSPNNVWHDASLKEWCYPAQQYDQFRDNWLKWSVGSVAQLQNDSNRNLEVEHAVYPENSYNANSEWMDSDLPWTWHFVSHVLEQRQNGYEESWIVIGEPNEIVSGFNYHHWQKWLQEANDGFNNNNPYLDKVLSKIEWTLDNFNNIDWDPIGRMKKLVVNNS
jgi:hypothetical protein